jgi:hypothetical protein
MNEETMAQPLGTLATVAQSTAHSKVPPTSGLDGAALPLRVRLGFH